MAINKSQRFTRERPCPVCDGFDSAPRGNGRRCYSFLSSDGLYAHCTRDEHAGTLPKNPDSNTYAHRLNCLCSCGVQHGRAAVTVKARRES